MAKRDIHQEITNQIISQIEAGTPAWILPWSGSAPTMPKRVTGESYQGINVLLLWAAREEGGYASNTWMTFNQAKKLGGNVVKGQKSTTIVYFGAIDKADEEGEDVRIPFLKSYAVFNVDQIENLPEGWQTEVKTFANDTVEEFEEFFDSLGVRREEGDFAAYWRNSDHITMPAINRFECVQRYYGVLAHETIHWTGDKKRLDRDKKYDTIEGRAFEELIAEIGSCFLCAEIGATPDQAQSAAYVETWLKALKNDKRFIFKATSQASKAVQFILNAAETGNMRDCFTTMQASVETQPHQQMELFL